MTLTQNRKEKINNKGSTINEEEEKEDKAKKQWEGEVRRAEDEMKDVEKSVMGRV